MQTITFTDAFCIIGVVLVCIAVFLSLIFIFGFLKGLKMSLKKVYDWKSSIIEEERSLDEIPCAEFNKETGVCTIQNVEPLTPEQQEFLNLHEQATEVSYSNHLPPNTYIPKELLLQVINLFQENIPIRDDRLGTIKAIVDKYYKDWFGGDVKVSAKLVFDIDRAFRYIQQHLPELRGENWIVRQKMGGEYVDAADYQAVKDLSNQMKLKFE